MITADIQTTLSTPNKTYVPQVVMQTTITTEGKLVTSCFITYAAAYVTNLGKPDEAWKDTGQRGSIHIDNMDKPDAALADYTQTIKDLMAKLSEVVAAVNAVKKVL
jgi:hypothetical protein